MAELTVDEVEILTNRIVNDLNTLALGDAIDAFRRTNHWSDIRDNVIGDAISDSEVVEGEEHRTTLSELDAANNDLKNLRDELVEDADILQEAIVEARVDDALAILREMFPEHRFLSPAAQKMLAGIHGQGTLAL